MARVITKLNGRLPLSALASIGGGLYLRKDAAASFLAARAAGLPWGVNTAYRDRAYQRRLYNDYRAGKGSMAEKPGKSWHGEGLALDLSAKSGAQAWMLAHPEYGWRRTIASEPWHFEFFPALYITGDDVNLSDPVGRNPVTGKPSDVKASLDIAKNYSVYGWKIGLEIRAQLAAMRSVLDQLAEATGAPIDYARIEGAINAAIAEGIDVDVTVTQR